ncbi:MAG: urease accessory protein UreD [Nitrososphaerales archaeon]
MTPSELQYFVPDDIPPEVLAYEAELPQLGVGMAGKVGALALTLEESAGKTVIRELYSRVPLRVQRALYLEESLPSMAYLFLISPSDGILQGDRLRMDIVLKNNAQAHITTQSATKLYYMEKNYATQIVNISLDDGCYLEYVPDQIIPYSHSRFYQKVSLKVNGDSTLVYSELVVPGRVAHGESFGYDICYLKTSARNQDDEPTFVDVARLLPKASNLKSSGVLGEHDVFGSVYVVTSGKHLGELKNRVNSAGQNFPNLFVGATTLPHDSGILVRVLGDTAEEIKAFVYEVVTIVRRLVLDAPFSGVRKR